MTWFLVALGGFLVGWYLGVGVGSADATSRALEREWSRLEAAAARLEADSAAWAVALEGARSCGLSAAELRERWDRLEAERRPPARA